MTASGTKSANKDNEWKQVTTNGNKWEGMNTSVTANENKWEQAK